MKNKIYIVANAGRSGSTYLYHLLRQQHDDWAVFHEHIPVQISRPRKYNRAFSVEAQEAVLSDAELCRYLDEWANLLERRSVVDTGWTVYHLLPVLQARFADQLKIIVLHRAPWDVAMSRANMGNYHQKTGYDEAHEVSPSDPRSIAPEYAHRWPDMNNVERCLYWWFVIYREIEEFLENTPNANVDFLSSAELFGDSAFERLTHIFDRTIEHRIANKNPVLKSSAEMYPLGEAYRNLVNHEMILNFARDRYGYDIDSVRLDDRAMKYQLPNSFLSKLRHHSGYWPLRRLLVSRIKKK